MVVTGLQYHLPGNCWSYCLVLTHLGIYCCLNTWSCTYCQEQKYRVEISGSLPCQLFFSPGLNFWLSPNHVASSDSWDYDLSFLGVKIIRASAGSVQLPVSHTGPPKLLMPAVAHIPITEPELIACWLGKRHFFKVSLFYLLGRLSVPLHPSSDVSSGFLLLVFCLFFWASFNNMSPFGTGSH